MKTINMEVIKLLSEIVIDGFNLPNYCVKYNLSFDKIVEGYIRQRKIKRLDSRSDMELVLALIKNQVCHKKYVNQSKIIIHGMKASDFAYMNNVPPVALRSSIYRGHQVHPEKSDDVLADEFVNRYKKNNMIFFYYGINLRDLPTQYGIMVDESKVKKIYLAEYEERDDISFEDAINEIVDTLIGIENKNMILKMKASQTNKDSE